MANQVNIHRSFPDMIVVMKSDEHSKYYPTMQSGITLVPPSKVKEIIDDLTEYCNAHTDAEIEAQNKLALDEAFLGRNSR